MRAQVLRFTSCWLWLVLSHVALGAASVHTTWLWHVHQPLYWPDRRTAGNDHYETAWDTIQQQDAGRGSPTPEVLRDIFGWADRVAAYQGRLRDSLGSISSHANSGAQVSYSGALMENVQSLGVAGALGYGANWYAPNQQARGWATSSGQPRMDLLNFTHHHSLAPLLSEETLEMELRIHQRQMELFWGTNPPVSRGYFPTETCFSTRLIPVLKRVGIDWSIVGNTHLARSCADFPLVIGSGGVNCDLPNKADQLNPVQGVANYQRVTIERGCAPTQVMPFGFQLHRARYVDPDTGEASTIIVVPSDQALGWRDSYGAWDLGLMDALAARNDPGKPALVTLAHDGDNGWSGGYSYYQEWVSDFASQATGRGYEPTTVEQFLTEHSPGTNDVVHVEEGGWVNADGDFGSPIFINWHWPPSYSSNGVNVVDPASGVSDKVDNWRVIVATENRVKTAQQIVGSTPRIDQVRDPWSFGQTPNAVELAWHYYLGGLDSGFVYFGCVGDMCQRSTIAQSNAMRHVDAILTNGAPDLTAPTVFLPQRHPWNPGGTNFGVQYSYQITVDADPDFWVWTYAYDVSGISNLVVKFRINGTNPPTSDQFHTYDGGMLTGPWQSSNMTQRVVAPVTGANPAHIADYYHALIGGVTNSFVDYYVEAIDNRGNTNKTDIRHVWVGEGGEGGGSVDPDGCSGRVCVAPVPPQQGAAVTIRYDATGGPLNSASGILIHLGWNNWNPVVSPDAAMTFNAASNHWEYMTAVPVDATQLDCVFNNGSGIWDNNLGQDWHFAVTTNSNPLPPPVPQTVLAAALSSNQIQVSWSASATATGYVLRRGGNPIAYVSSTTHTDSGLQPLTQYCYTVAATNAVGASAASTPACTTTLSVDDPPVTNYPPFVMDGAVDFEGYAVASPGMTLYAALRGTKLYVATESAANGSANDHFIFVSDQLLPSATANAPWAKSGKIAVASSKPYLAAEGANNYQSWYNAPSGSGSAKAPTSAGHLEGTIDLAAAFGSVPSVLYLSAAAYTTVDGGPLADSAPSSVGPDLNPDEFLAIPTVALRDLNADGLFDRLDPNLDFRITRVERAGNDLVLDWNAMPGSHYTVVTEETPGTNWTDVPGSATNASPLQVELSFTNSLSTSATQHFFRIKLTP